MKKQLLILIALCTAVLGYSQTFTDANFIEYTIIPSTNTVEVTDYDFPNGGVAVNIPATVDYNSVTYTVTAIGNLAFYTDPTIGEYITNLTFALPSNIISIDENAFNGNHLTNVTIPDSVINIGPQAFSFNNLTDIIIGNTVETISASAFNNNDLTSITIPDSVTSIGSGAFRNNNLLTCVISESITPATLTTDNSDPFLNLRSNIDLSIPSGSASAYATAEWTGFKSVAEGLTGTFIVDNITYQINPTPFSEVTITDYNTAGGTVVTIPDTVNSGCTEYSVVAIGNGAFQSNNLTSVTISNTVISIEEGAFNNNSINNLILGNNVEIIGNWAFQNNALISVTIPDSVTNISFRAFNINSIINLSLGNSVETIGENAFSDNIISSIIIPDSVLTIGDSAFANNINTTSIVLGNNVTTIGDFAFAISSPSSTVTNITIPSNVTTIGTFAFAINTLTDITSLATIPPVITTGTNDTFTSIANRGNIHLHIPGGTAVMDAYVNDAGALWTGFNPVTQDALSVSDFELANNIKVITTPNALKVVTSNGVNLQNYTIYSISRAKVNSGTQSEIATTTFAKGIYILKLDFNKGTMVTKVIVQ